MQAAFAEEVFLPEIVEDEFVMSDPQYNGLAQRVTTLEQKIAKSDRTLEKLASNAVPLATSIAKIETGMEWQEKFLKYAAGFAVLWLGGLTIWGLTLLNRVGALEGGGSYHTTERALQDSKTPEEASANLGLLVAQIQKRASIGKPLNQSQLDTVAETVSDAAKSFPDLPKVWDVAATVINVKFAVNRSNMPSESLPNCLDALVQGDVRDRFTRPDGTKTEEPGFMDAPAGIPWRAHALVHDCVLDLDATPNFDSTSVGKFFASEKAHHPNTVALDIEVSNAKIIYSGGPMLPVSEIHLVNCVFDLRPTGVPPAKGRRLTEHLLTADVANDTIDLAG